MSLPFYTGQVPTADDFNLLAVKSQLAASGGANMIGYGGTTVAAVLAGLVAPSVTSVNGHTGAVVLGATDIAGVALLNGDSTQNFSVKNATGSQHAVPLAQADARYAPFGSGGGGVSSVGLSMPPDFSVTGTPITTSGSFGVTWASQAPKTFLAAPTGATGTPVFRNIAAADIPTLNQNTSGTAAGLSATLAQTSGGTGGNTRQLGLNALTNVAAASVGYVVAKDGSGNAVFAPNTAGDYVSVISYGATGNGTTDDSAAVQACLTYCTANGKTAYFPSGTYKCVTPLTVNTGTSWAHFGPRCNLKGAGAANTRILYPSGTGILLSIGGFGAQYHVDIQGLTFQGPGYVDETGHPALDLPGTGTGIYSIASSDMSIRDCVISGFNRGITVYDSFLVYFSNTYIRTNNQGIFLGYTVYSNPNAITFVACSLNENRDYAMYADKGVAISMFGGSVEGNGIGGTGAFIGGIQVTCGDQGCIDANFDGVYFEGNAGTADIYITGPSSSGASCIKGCTFNRVASTHYTTYCILADAGGGIKNRIAIVGCGFSGFNDYAPNAGRPYLKVLSGDVRFSWMGCYFQSATEAPSYNTPINYITGGNGLQDNMHVVFAGGSGSGTISYPTTGAPVTGAPGWFKFTTDAIDAAGYSGIWVQGWPVT